MVSSDFIKQSIGAPFMKVWFRFVNFWTITWVVLSMLAVGGYWFALDAAGNLESFWPGFLRLVPVSLVFVLGIGFVVLFIHDRTQTDNPVQRMFPVVYWGRKMAIAMGPLFRQYMFANDTEEKPYDRITRNWVYQTSRGKRNTIGFGSQADMDGVGATMVLPATFTNQNSMMGEDIGRHYHKVIGEASGVKNKVILHSFIAISAMSFGALSYRAHAALNLGARKAGILHNTGEGGLAPCHEYGGGDLIFQIGTGKYGVRDDAGKLNDDLLRKTTHHKQVKLIEIKLAQGAKPGKGGMLLKEKITKEISEIRKIPMGEDCHSPPRHSEFNDVGGLFDFIDRIREIAGKPVGIKMVIGHTHEIEAIARMMAQNPGRGPDYISIDGGDGGTGAAPLVLASHAGLPVKQGIAVADWALKRHGVRDKVILFAGGKIATPIDAAVVMALGADVVYIARAFLLALGCIQALECHSNHCPTGIATQDKRLQKALDIEAAADRVATYAKSLYKETQMLGESCGYSSPDQITADDIMVVTSPGHLDYLSELHGVSAYEASLEREKARELGMTVGEMKMRAAESGN